MIIKTINKLRIGLSGTLPGTNSHKKMFPNVRFTGKKQPDKLNSKKSSVLILLYPKNNTLYIPFIQRHIYNGAHSGQISLPGGKYELSDKNLKHTALRETEEEIGIKPDSIEILGQLSSIYIPNSNFNVMPYIGFTNNTPVFTPDPFEVHSIIEAPLSKLIDPYSLDRYEKVINGVQIVAPCFNINNHKIWGATAMIISEFIDIINNSNDTTPSGSYNARNARGFQ